MRVRWPLVAAAALALAVSVVMASPAVRRREVVMAPGGGALVLSAVAPDDVFGPELPTRSARDKRKLGWILDFVFWKFNKVLELKTRLVSAIASASGGRSRPVSSAIITSSRVTTTEAPPIEFEGNKVSLVLPDELFGSAFTVVTDVSKIIGSVIMNSATRTKTFIDALKPIFRRALGIRESTSVVIGDRLPNQLVIPSVAGETVRPMEDEPAATTDSLSSSSDVAERRSSRDTNEA
ncbi:uncharacterized protein LOC124162257 [Ischnura elegans]|uniref:uncharacterized protein LOC124162257 n=1 Tax=Ischnura elegans TaxID=197161 RepID=UPI001ED87143|nr:uncharacterized protein LOC124162257 [Ischnura elegans]